MSRPLRLGASRTLAFLASVRVVLRIWRPCEVHAQGRKAFQGLADFPSVHSNGVVPFARLLACRGRLKGLEGTPFAPLQFLENSGLVAVGNGRLDLRIESQGRAGDSSALRGVAALAAKDLPEIDRCELARNRELAEEAFELAIFDLNYGAFKGPYAILSEGDKLTKRLVPIRVGNFSVLP